MQLNQGWDKHLLLALFLFLGFILKFCSSKFFSCIHEHISSSWLVSLSTFLRISVRLCVSVLRPAWVLPQYEPVWLQEEAGSPRRGRKRAERGMKSGQTPWESRPGKPGGTWKGRGRGRDAPACPNCPAAAPLLTWIHVYSEIHLYFQPESIKWTKKSNKNKGKWCNRQLTSCVVLTVQTCRCILKTQFIHVGTIFWIMSHFNHIYCLFPELKKQKKYGVVKNIPTWVIFSNEVHRLLFFYRLILTEKENWSLKWLVV